MIKNSFTEDDLKKYKQFNETVAKHAIWKDLTTQELAQVFNCLAWFSGLQAKIEANIMEIKSIKHDYKPETNPNEVA